MKHGHQSYSANSVYGTAGTTLTLLGIIVMFALFIPQLGLFVAVFGALMLGMGLGFLICPKMLRERELEPEKQPEPNPWAGFNPSQIALKSDQGHASRKDPGRNYSRHRREYAH